MQSISLYRLFVLSTLWSSLLDPDLRNEKWLCDLRDVYSTGMSHPKFSKLKEKKEIGER